MLRHRGEHVCLLSPSPFWWTIKIHGSTVDLKLRGRRFKGKIWEQYFRSESQRREPQELSLVLEFVLGEVGSLLLLQELWCSGLKNNCIWSLFFGGGDSIWHLSQWLLLVLLLELQVCGPHKAGVAELIPAHTLIATDAPGSWELGTSGQKRRENSSTDSTAMGGWMWHECRTCSPTYGPVWDVQSSALARHQGCT